MDKVAIRRISGPVALRPASPDPTANRLDRYHQTIKLNVSQIPYDVPGDWEIAIMEFVNPYINRRYHKALERVTPSDVSVGRKEYILRKRKEVQTQTFQC